VSVRARPRPWLTWALCGAIVSALGFTGGALLERHDRPASSRASLFSAAAFSGAARSGAPVAPSAGGGGAGSGAITGSVFLVDGDTVYLTESSGSIVKVVTGGSTSVQLYGAGTLSGLKAGQTVTVRGSTDSSGDVTATGVTVTGG